MVVVPAPAGLFPRAAPRLPRPARRPRACGAVPEPVMSSTSRASSSPRLRGCSRLDDRAADRIGVVPAHAGVVPRPWQAPRSAARSPPRPAGLFLESQHDRRHLRVVRPRAGHLPGVPLYRSYGFRELSALTCRCPTAPSSTACRWSTSCRDDQRTPPLRLRVGVTGRDPHPVTPHANRAT